jgi:hypothetical protein
VSAICRSLGEFAVISVLLFQTCGWITFFHSQILQVWLWAYLDQWNLGISDVCHIWIEIFNSVSSCPLLQWLWKNILRLSLCQPVSWNEEHWNKAQSQSATDMWCKQHIKPVVQSHWDLEFVEADPPCIGYYFSLLLLGLYFYHLPESSEMEHTCHKWHRGYFLR